MEFFTTISLVDGPVVFGCYLVAGFLAFILLAVRPSRKWSRQKWLLTAVIAAALGVFLGVVGLWVCVDWLDLYGVSLSWTTRMWVCAAFLAISVTLCSLFRSRLWRLPLTVFSLILFLLVPALRINADFGTYQTLGSILGLDELAGQSLPELARPTAHATPLFSHWVPPADMPTQGVLSSVTIPATVSGFPARNAAIYLPPAALGAHPPDLPVLIALSGQPGKPSDVLLSGKLAQTLDEFARSHNGLAPIVVSPDQLGESYRNPMCVDGSLGNSATYLTVDVPQWIKNTLPVSTKREHWAISGFSQGGTCAVQLAAEYPDIFGSFLAISAELVPANGNEEETISRGFSGDKQAYLAAQPVNILKKNTPYSNTFAIFAVGENDSRFQPRAQELSGAARRAGMTVTYFEAPGSSHDYGTAAYSFARGSRLLAEHWGLSR